MSADNRPMLIFNETMTGAFKKFKLPEETQAVLIQMRDADEDVLVSHLAAGTPYFTVKGWSAAGGARESQLHFYSGMSMEGGAIWLSGTNDKVCEIICFRR